MSSFGVSMLMHARLWFYMILMCDFFFGFTDGFDSTPVEMKLMRNQHAFTAPYMQKKSTVTTKKDFWRKDFWRKPNRMQHLTKLRLRRNKNWRFDPEGSPPQLLFLLRSTKRQQYQVPGQPKSKKRALPTL
jgi:hypothetical protein